MNVEKQFSKNPIIHGVIVASFVLYYAGIFQVFSIGAYGVTFVDLTFLILYSIILKNILLDGAQLKIFGTTALFFLGGLVFAIILSGITPLIEADPEKIVQYFKTSIHLYYILFLVAIFAVYPIKYAVWLNSIKSWLILSLFINTFGIYQIFARIYDLPFAWIEITNVSLSLRKTIDVDELSQLSLKFGNFYRATSIFSEPSGLAGFNLYIFIFIVAPYIHQTKSFFSSRTLNLIILILCLANLFITFSLTGFLGVAIIYSTMTIIARKTNILKILGIFLAGALLIYAIDSYTKDIFSISVIDLFSTRISGILGLGDASTVSGESFYTRASNAEEMFGIFSRNPFFGCGLGLTQYDEISFVNFSDYTVMAALAETGLIGMASIVGLFAVLFFKSLKIFKNDIFSGKYPQKFKTLLSVVLYVIILQIIINFISGNNFISIVLWLPMAMIFSIFHSKSIYDGESGKVLRLSFLKIRAKSADSIQKYLQISKK